MRSVQSDLIEYLDPVIPRKSGQVAVPAVTEVRGKRIAFLENGWKSFVKMGERLEQVLKDEHGVATFRMLRTSSRWPSMTGLGMPLLPEVNSISPTLMTTVPTCMIRLMPKRCSAQPCSGPSRPLSSRFIEYAADSNVEDHPNSAFNSTA